MRFSRTSPRVTLKIPCFFHLRCLIKTPINSWPICKPQRLCQGMSIWKPVVLNIDIKITQNTLKILWVLNGRVTHIQQSDPHNADDICEKLAHYSKDPVAVLLSIITSAAQFVHCRHQWLKKNGSPDENLCWNRQHVHLAFSFLETIQIDRKVIVLYTKNDIHSTSSLGSDSDPYKANCSGGKLGDLWSCFHNFALKLITAGCRNSGCYSNLSYYLPHYSL